MSYTHDVLTYLKIRGLKSFTHKDILFATPANCSYSVLRNIKRALEKEGKFLQELLECGTSDVYDPLIKEYRTITKRYKRYFIMKKEQTA